MKKAVSGEGTQLTKAEGTGKYLADHGKKVIARPARRSLFVNGNDLLAFEDTIDWDIRLMRRVAAMVSGGCSASSCEAAHDRFYRHTIRSRSSLPPSGR